MLKARIIPCLDVKDGRVVKGVNFVDLRDAGDPVEQARVYDNAGADELCFLDIAASHENRDTLFDVVRATAEQCRTLAAAVSDMALTGRDGDLEAYLRADQLFHRTLLAASGNDMFAALSGLVAETLEGRTHHHLMPAEPKREAVDLHDEVSRAVRHGDAVAAERAMAAIIDEAAAAVTAQFAPDRG